ASPRSPTRAPGPTDRRTTRSRAAGGRRAPAASRVAPARPPCRCLDSSGRPAMMPAMPRWVLLPLPANASVHKRWRGHVVVAVLSGPQARPLWAEPLGELLAAVAAGARFDVPTRADVQVDCTPGCQTRQAVLLGRGDVVYIETRDGLRALVRSDDVLVARDAH